VSTTISKPVEGGTTELSGSTGRFGMYVGTRHPKFPVAVVVSVACAVVIVVVAPVGIGPQIYVFPFTVKVPANIPLLSAILCPMALSVALTPACL
jgi:hypothetical protein